MLALSKKLHNNVTEKWSLFSSIYRIHKRLTVKDNSFCKLKTKIISISIKYLLKEE